MFDFPSSPTLDQEFTPAGGPTYKWNGYAWNKKATAGGAGGGVIIGSAPPVAEHGTMFWEDDTGQLYIRYNDGNSTQWVQVASPGIPDSAQDDVIYARRNGVWVPPPLSFRNKIINGDMRINQRGAASLTTSGQYLNDRWGFQSTSGSAQLAIGNAGTLSLVGGQLLSIGATAAKPSLAAGDYAAFSQTIEGFHVADLFYGNAVAKPFTLSFRAAAVTPMTMSVSFRNSATNRSYVATVDVTPVHTSYSITVPGDTAGTWLTGSDTGIYVWFMFCCGTSYLTPNKNVWQAGNLLAHSSQSNGLVSGQALYVADVQLEAGSVATPFEKKPYGTEMALCQRYFERLYNDLYAPPTTDVYGRQYWFFKVEKRANPTVVLYSGSVTDGVGAALDIVYFYKGASTPVNIKSGTTASAEL